MKKHVWVLGGVAGIGLLVAVLWWSSTRGHDSVRSHDTTLVTDANTNRVSGRRPKAVVPHDTPLLVAETTATGSTARIQKQPVDFLDADTDATTAPLDDFLDDENIAGILQESKRLIKHANPDVRHRVAFALSWIGMAGLPDLTVMLTDPDPDVAADALDYWTSSLAELGSEEDKAALLGAAAQVFGADISDEVLWDLVLECAMLDSDVALPQLVTMLQTVTKPDQKQEVIDAIHSTLFELEEEPSENEAELVAQVKRELALLAAEREKEKAELQEDTVPGAADGAEATSGQGFRVPAR